MAKKSVAVTSKLILPKNAQVAASQFVSPRGPPAPKKRMPSGKKEEPVSVIIGDKIDTKRNKKNNGTRSTIFSLEQQKATSFYAPSVPDAAAFTVAVPSTLPPPSLPPLSVRTQPRSLLKAVKEKVNSARDQICLTIHLHMLAVLIFTFVGAGIFYAMNRHTIDSASDEGPCLDILFNDRNNCANWSTSLLSLQRDGNDTDFEWNCSDSALDLHDEYATCLRQEGAWAQATTDRFVYSLIYVISICTTIGYGNVVATGTASYLIMIVYSIVGIPLFFAALDDMADCVRDQFVSLYTRLKSARMTPEEKRRSENYFLPPMQKKVNDGDCIPFSVICILTAGYLFALAGCCYPISHFNSFIEAYYFIFQSVAMIGFGDVVPENYNLHLLYFIFVLIGLVLLSMCFFTLQEWMRGWGIAVVKTVTTGRRAKKRIIESSLESASRLAALTAVQAPLSKNEWRLPKTLGSLVKLRQADAATLSADSVTAVLAIKPPPSIYSRAVKVNRFHMTTDEDEDSDFDDDNDFKDTL